MNDLFDVHALNLPDKGTVLVANAGPRQTNEEGHVTDWARKVEIYVSPAGRSVRVFVDGVEVQR